MLHLIVVWFFIVSGGFVYAKETDEDDSQWDSLVYWTGGQSPLRATLRRSPTGRLSDSLRLDDFGETFALRDDPWNDIEVTGTVQSYQPGFNGAIGSRSFNWYRNGNKLKVSIGSNSLTVSMDDKEVTLQEYQYYQPKEVKYSLDKKELYTESEKIKVLFDANNHNLYNLTVLPANISTYKNGSGWFENAAAAANITNSSGDWRSVGRINDHVNFELNSKWFHINGTTGNVTVENDFSNDAAVLNTKISDRQTALIHAFDRKIVVLHDYRANAYEARVINGNNNEILSTVRFDAKNLRADGFSYNMAGRVMILTDGELSAGNLEQLQVVGRQSIRLDGVVQTLLMDGQKITCRDHNRNNDRDSNRDSHDSTYNFVALADGFRFHSSQSVLGYDRAAGSLWLKSIGGKVNIDIAKRQISPNDIIHSIRNTQASQFIEMNIAKEIDLKVEFGDGFVNIQHLTYSIYVSLTGDGRVELDIVEAGWTANGGFWARCTGSGLRGDVQPSGKAGKESEAADKKWATWTATGRRVRATLSASGSVYARDNTRELTFSTTDSWCCHLVVLRMFGVQLEINDNLFN